MPESLKSRTVSGVFWSGVERFSVQAVQLVIGILIARVLSPTDYGIVGMLAIFLSISQMLISSGFVAALIRKIDRTQTDCSTVFYFKKRFTLFWKRYFLLYYFNLPWFFDKYSFHFSHMISSSPLYNFLLIQNIPS